MHATRFAHDHHDGCERKHAGATQLACARHVPDVPDATEHEGVETMALHAREDLRAPFPSQAGEVDSCVVLEAHHTDQQTTIAWSGTHARTPYGS